MRICPKCAAENPDDALFCVSCGEKLESEEKPESEEKTPEGFVKPAGMGDPVVLIEDPHTEETTEEEAPAEAAETKETEPEEEKEVIEPEVKYEVSVYDRKKRFFAKPVYLLYVIALAACLIILWMMTKAPKSEPVSVKNVWEADGIVLTEEKTGTIYFTDAEGKNYSGYKMENKSFDYSILYLKNEETGNGLEYIMRSHDTGVTLYPKTDSMYVTPIKLELTSTDE